VLRRKLRSRPRVSGVAAVFQSVPRPGSPLTERTVNFIVKEAAERAGVNSRPSSDYEVVVELLASWSPGR
jgi:hypothetical protein